MATEPKRQEPDVPPQKPDIQPEPRPEEIPQDKDFPKKTPRLCSFRDLPHQQIWLLSPGCIFDLGEHCPTPN